MLTPESPATCNSQSWVHRSTHHVEVHLQHIHRGIPNFVVCCIDQNLIKDFVKAGGEADVLQHHVAAIVDPQLVILLLSAAQQQERPSRTTEQLQCWGRPEAHRLPFLRQISTCQCRCQAAGGCAQAETSSDRSPQLHALRYLLSCWAAAQPSCCQPAGIEML